MKNIPENKKMFLLGLGGSFGLMFFVGFLILLSIVLSGKTVASDDQVKQNNQPSVRNQAPQPSAAPAGDIRLAAISADDHIRGADKAPITIVEFSDPECPFCKRFHDTMNQVMAKYPDQVRWVYKHAPLDSLHSKARKEAEATECAAELGGNDGFWAFLDKLFEITPSNNGLAESQLYDIADAVGLNKTKFTDCLNSGRYKDKVQQQLDEAIAAGMQGTPYSVIVAGGTNIPLSGAQPFAVVSATLDSLLK
ncbi:disulfide bond formation protein DsbA [Candidatus Falkowbacteria bacterium CG10_big_fil_rev_8_21_14_0_10_39_11]|uniref:Disulfide bond formation protein DsbA n=1 Tax=Candidatus Falkowbacteria bacterium CG10_big_fil_rev_8_21_14_0_10_39_11 TaxID=1974565 RepID=A0A2H0V6K7_9BACT|nr:MAG: disulfide bond formation protein DsbA [Candidatus Falkowbacteria bacterium CG10_big_fil_rev_8_21_14_0_10_39_11]